LGNILVTADDVRMCKVCFTRVYFLYSNSTRPKVL